MQVHNIFMGEVIFHLENFNHFAEVVPRRIVAFVACDIEGYAQPINLTQSRLAKDNPGRIFYTPGPNAVNFRWSHGFAEIPTIRRQG